MGSHLSWATNCIPAGIYPCGCSERAEGKAVDGRFRYANMMVGTSDDDLLPHRILLLVKGTEDTQLLPTANSEAKARMLLSKNVKCLLSDDSPNITMKGYASEVGLIKLALHEDFGLVTVSCISKVER